MNLFLLYLISFTSFVIPFVIFLIFKKNQKAPENFTKLIKIVSGLLIFFLINAFFHIDPSKAMMTWDSGKVGLLKESQGCVNLVGVPYGSNKVANFFAWFANMLFYPSAFFIAISIFIPFKTAKLINKWVILPLSTLVFFTLFNLLLALKGSISFDYQSIFVALAVGLTLSLSVLIRIQYHNETKQFVLRDFINGFVFWLIALIAFMPAETKATLFSTEGTLFGVPQNSLRPYDFSELHRMYMYLAIIGFIVLYFLFRDTEYSVRKAMIMIISVGAMRVFLEQRNFISMFPIVNGKLSIDVLALPIHLCNTAMFIIPICLTFNSKRLFYFTYFINVFGAMCAIFAPNNGEFQNCFSPNVVIFWINHFGAWGFPLICVALKVFDRPKFKQMLWSLLFFGIYYIFIMFMNAWFSNYTPGGTDYLFINSDFILSKLFDDAMTAQILNNTFTWHWGDLDFTIRPLYQYLFFGGYVVIAFCMWFVYSLFFRIADSHYELLCLLKVAKKENITMKEKRLMTQIDESNLKASLVFDEFTKRYGNSQVLAANKVKFKVEGNEIFGFLGPNGAGKSTCIKSAIGIQPVTGGHISVCGYDVGTQPVEAKKQIGYVPDHYALYEKLTGREYINYIADLYNVSKADRNERMKKYVELFELNQAFDNRMETYSHGMKQKIAIMAALIHNPKIWILDEPLTGLDPQSIFQVKKCMKEHAAKGNVVFFSSHIIDVVEKLCTRIAIIIKGQIVFEGDLKDIEKKHPEGLESFYLETIQKYEE